MNKYETENKNATQRVILPVCEFSIKHNLPLGGLRHLIFLADKNGFNRVIRRIGRKILLDEEQFFLWLDESNGVTAAKY